MHTNDVLLHASHYSSGIHTGVERGQERVSKHEESGRSLHIVAAAMETKRSLSVPTDGETAR